jgi:glycerophosphoryl diester phosphodiesterase
MKGPDNEPHSSVSSQRWYHIDGRYPLVMAHRGSIERRAEATIERMISAIERGASIIELDIRKSADGALFCYHGNVLECILSRLLFHSTLSSLRQRYRQIIPLGEFLKEIGSRAIPFLDIKDSSITKADIEKALESTNIRMVYVASNSLRFHKKVGKVPSSWCKVYNIGLLFPLRRIEAVISAGVSVVELFVWDFHMTTLAWLRSRGVEIALSRLFVSRKSYRQLCMKWKAYWIT